MWKNQIFIALRHILISSFEEKTWSNELTLIAVALQGIRNKYLILMKMFALFTFLRGRTKVNQNEFHGHACFQFRQISAQNKKG